MAAEVDFGDLELFEAFDPREESTPKPVHTRFKDEDGDGDEEEDQNGGGDAELRERLRQCEETIEQLRAENQELKRKLNILTRPRYEILKLHHTSPGSMAGDSRLLLCCWRFQPPGQNPSVPCISAVTAPNISHRLTDVEVAHGSQGAGAFQFQPPLPRGTPPPVFVPPLPKGTPPLTPRASPQPRAAAVDEDALTLEELEEQQRRIWAALEQTEGAASDSDPPGDTPLTGTSVASSPSAPELELQAREGTVLEEPKAPTPDAETMEDDVGLPRSPILEATPKSPKAEEEPMEPDSLEVEPGASPLGNGTGTGTSNGTGTSTILSNCDIRNGDTRPPTAAPQHSPVPDMSKFAMGITPFEFENMAESTGMYLRIRSLLRNSPRSQQRSKKAPE
ncbi:zinc finger CCHC domain-containing protein 8 [Octodon degus]|uniref:Zinc finger CCHC domain-containing protein 8 n=1 Tax=Octodon degus TaxID=10160 RepID=A0A6P6EVU7_OCTDE|nr:zinc finger CCHC domain-containing protein 8 [Octodon degus]